MSNQLWFSTTSKESHLIRKSIKSILKITYYNLFVLFILIQSNSLLAAPTNKMPPPKIDIKEYLHIERIKNSIQLQWDDYESLPKTNFDDYLSQYEHKIKGYLVTIYEEADEKNSNGLKSLIVEYGYSRRTYFTDLKCLKINNVSKTLKSIVYLSYVFEVTNNFNKTLNIVGITKTNPIIEDEGLNVPMETSSKNFNSGQTCKHQNFEKVTLKKLYDNKDLYVNKLIEVSGSVKSGSNKLKKITSCLSRGDGAIYSDKYYLCIPGFYRFNMTLMTRKINVKKISMIGYLTKYEFQTKPGVTETQYHFSRIDITGIK